ncbi:DoxX family protein [Granulicella sibirica]|uniref:Membrane protein n=1 Tax=Granulicella sibirica TaxID=2479048 RepID=A0A4Q0SYA8_9BACT|nr:DoxX family protein [Granulicella sibirica]RXH56165.1 membrane protein [Granulicella sibirica]
MSTKARNILGWTLAVLNLLLLGASATDKIIGSQHALAMGASFGLSAEAYRVLGIIELASAILFVFPRTAILGFLLLSSYMGGAIATHLQHHEPIGFPTGIEMFIWIIAVLRFPEVTARLRGLGSRIAADSYAA